MSPEKIKHQISLWDKNAQTIEIVSSGATNIVGLTETTAYRFPITEDAIAIQLYEAALYKQLGERLNVDVPQLVRTYDKPKCIAITRLHGRHLSTDELAALPNGDLRNIIRQLLEFSVALNKVIDVATVQELEDTLIANKAHERPWHEYLAMHLKNARFPEQPWLEDLAHQHYQKWLDIVSSSALPKQVVHDELHDANLLFSGHTLSGIIDFGDSTVGTIAQELRQLLRVSDEAARIAIDEYKVMTGILIDFNEIHCWAVAQELASYCRWFTIGAHDRPSFIRSQANLRRLIADFQG